MEEGAELIVDGCFLGNYGYLKTDGLTLIHRGSLRNYGSGTVEFYAPESTLKLGSEREEWRYNGTDCLLNEGIILNAGKIELYDNALMIMKGVLEGNMVQIRDHACLVNVGQIQWMDGSSIEISGEGRFHNQHRQSWSQELTMHIAEGGIFNNFDCLDIQSGNINVDQGGSFGSKFGYITFGNNLSVLNYGLFAFCQGGDCSLLQGYFENHGYLHLVGPSGFVIDAPYGAVNPACLNNQGEVRIGDSDGYIRIDNGEFTGNEAIYRALE